MHIRNPSSLLLLTLANTVPSLASSFPAILKVPDADWQSLNASVDGRLGALRPLAEPCYLSYSSNGRTRSQAPDLEACRVARNNSANVDFISSHPAAYHDPFYGTCMSEGYGCPLFDVPANETERALQATCYQGNLPDYYIEVREVSDIQAGLKFAEEHHLPLVIKNTGHDYKGRSAGRHSLEIWYVGILSSYVDGHLISNLHRTHNLQPPMKIDKDFRPVGCGKSVGSTITYGAGANFETIYKFAHEHGHMVCVTRLSVFKDIDCSLIARL